MKQLSCLLLALIILLSGCTVPNSQLPETTTTAPVTTQEVTTAPTETTVPPTTEETDPPAPRFDPYELMETMTTQELVGQILLARCPSGSTALAHVEQYHLGGYILFAQDFDGQTPTGITKTIASYQEAAQIPLLIAVDEEGGTVCRVSSRPAFRSSRFLSPRKLFNQGGQDLVIETETEKCQLLSSLGINVNLAPVCDITTDPDAFMYSRSLGQSPEVTGQCIAAMVQTMHDGGIGGVLKHFPGYGNNTDTHVGIANDKRSLETLENGDLVPFQYGIEAGCDAIMISHTFIECLDTSLPASLSPTVIGYLRNTMDFTGVIVTDDLCMGAITDLYGTGEAAVLAVLAGNDLLISTYYPQQYAAILEAVEDGRIPMWHLQNAVARVLQWKYDLGLITAD